jgi:hypothetical protein
MPKNGIMSFDDALKRVLDTAVSELTVRAAEERDRARQQGFEEGRTEGFDDGHAKGLEDGRAEGATEGHARGWQDGHERGRSEALAEANRQSDAALAAAVAAARAETAADRAAYARLVDAIRALDRGRSLSDVLDTLVACASREATRTAVVIVRGQRVHTWTCLGFGTAVDTGPSLDIALDEAGVIAEAVRTGAMASDETGDHAGPPAFAPLRRGHESHETFAAPIALLGEVVAVLYADHGQSHAETMPDAPAPSLQAWPERLEVLTRHAARCLEALTVIKAARSLDGARAGNTDGEDPDTSARRYAKLLVSEIKLYHEADVVAGRRERDLSTRLGGEISRARALYEQRVPATVRDRGNYFRDELVRTLAHGDASLLQLT